MSPPAAERRSKLILAEQLRADLSVPGHLEPLALGVIGNAGEAEGLQFATLSPRLLNQPRPPPKLDEASANYSSMIPCLLISL